MTRANLIEQLADTTGRTKKEAEDIVDAVLSGIGDALAKGENVDLRGFGSFQVNSRPERQGRNPKTGEPLTISARKVAVFKPGKELAKAVNGGDATGGEAGETDVPDSIPHAQLSLGSAKVHGDKLEHRSET
jgi:DNA-binding protein HU-beta